MDIQKRNKMVEENLKLVSHAISLLKVQWNEDYFQQGVLELIRCTENYDESKGYKFSTYATRCIMLKLRDYIKRDYVLKPKLVDMKKGNVYAPPVVSLDNIVHDAPGDKAITLQDVIPAKEEWDMVDLKIELENIVAKDIITEDELELFIDSQINGYTLRNLSKKYHIPNKVIKEKIITIRETLQKNISYNYYEGGQ